VLNENDPEKNFGAFYRLLVKRTPTIYNKLANWSLSKKGGNTLLHKSSGHVVFITEIDHHSLTNTVPNQLRPGYKLELLGSLRG
jgi:hypothetical protein